MFYKKISGFDLEFSIREIDVFAHDRCWKIDTERRNHRTICFCFISGGGFGILTKPEFLKQSECQTGTPFSNMD